MVTGPLASVHEKRLGQAPKTLHEARSISPRRAISGGGFRAKINPFLRVLANVSSLAAASLEADARVSSNSRKLRGTDDRFACVRNSP